MDEIVFLGIIILKQIGIFENITLELSQIFIYKYRLQISQFQQHIHLFQVF